jgi:dCMP deaminase
MNLTKWDYRFLRLAKEVSSWSRDPSTKVGAVIVNPEKHVVSLGFNGFPSYMQDDFSLYADREEKYSRIVHGEINALVLARRDVYGCTLYTWPFLPCDRCAVIMIQAGIRRVVAPTPLADQAARWAGAFDKTKKYFDECKVEWSEPSREELIQVGVDV